MDIDHDGASPWDDVPSQGNDIPESSATSKPSQSESSPKATSKTSTSASGTGTVKGRSSRAPKRFVTNSTKLQSVDTSTDPLLGPLGDSTSQSEQDTNLLSPPPTSSSLAKPTASSNASLKTLLGSVTLEDSTDLDSTTISNARTPPPVQPATAPQTQRQTKPSVGVVEASKPYFHITVGDPHKVGDLTSAHTEYQVYTKTTSKAYRNSEFAVSRRFRDFLWLYNTLHTNNPGVIVPPPPEKQAVGRFNADFVESRRQALERMLNKTAAHPVLQRDGDLKLFLESESFNLDIKHKERKEPLVTESKGMFSSIGLGSSGPKYQEHDDWFHDRRIYLDALENQLKALEKAVETVVTQRKVLSESCGDFSISLHSLAAVEISPALSGPLEGLSELQHRVRELYERQAQQDILTIGIVIDEYVRMIGSCKQAFGMREKCWYSWQSADNDLQKKRSTQDKLMRSGRSQQDRLTQLEAEVAESEKKAHQARLLWDDMGKILRGELDRFEKEKVEEFKSAVETYLESAVEAQKELIEIWETYLMRLDAEDENDAEENEPLISKASTSASAPAVQPPSSEDQPEQETGEADEQI